jgi:hypothetical protein
MILKLDFVSSLQQILKLNVVIYKCKKATKFVWCLKSNNYHIYKESSKPRRTHKIPYYYYYYYYYLGGIPHKFFKNTEFLSKKISKKKENLWKKMKNHLE